MTRGPTSRRRWIGGAALAAIAVAFALVAILSGGDDEPDGHVVSDAVAATPENLPPESLAARGEPARDRDSSVPAETAPSSPDPAPTVPPVPPAALDAAEGPVVVGTVTTPEGLPTGATVLLCDATGDVGAVSAGDDGTFRLPAKRGGKFAIHASHVAIGAVDRTGVVVADAGATNVGTLRLEAAGVIEGRVELPDGTPAPEQDVAVNPAEKPPRACGSETRLAQAHTDAQGRFAFRALVPGRYGVRMAVKEFDADAQRLVETGTRDVRIVLKARMLVLRLRDAAGHPMPDASLSYEAITDDDSFGGAGAGSWGNAADKVLLFRDPVRLLVTASARGLESEPTEIELPEARWHVESTLVIRAPSARGTIGIDLRDATGAVVPTFHATAEVRVGRSTRLFGGASWSPDEDGSKSPPLRPGDYELTVIPGQGKLPSRPGGPCFQPVVRHVTVLAGNDVTVRMVATPGGWLRAKLWGVRDNGVGTGVFRDGARKAIRAMWQDTETVGLWHGLDGAGPQFFGSPLEPGRFVLSVEAKGFAAKRVPFEIRAGETTDVEVALEAK